MIKTQRQRSRQQEKVSLQIITYSHHQKMMTPLVIWLHPSVTCIVANIIIHTDLTNLVMAWYYSGYYTGYYQGLRSSQ